MKHVRPACQPNRGFYEQLDAYDVVLTEFRRRQDEIRRVKQEEKAKTAALNLNDKK